MNHRTAPTWMVGVFLFLGACVLSSLARAEDPVPPAAAAAESVAAPAATPPATPVATGISAEKPEFIGAETCLNCHEAQGGFKNSHHSKAFNKVKGIEFEKSCETCHGPGSLHAAAAGDRAHAGFATIKKLSALSAVELNKTCMECHAGAEQMHWVGSVHEARDVSCTACHSIHTPKNEKLLLKTPTINESCAQCHREVVARTKRNAHMPLEEGKMSCSDCHNPHGTANPKQVKADSVTALCFSCHADKRGPFLFEHMPVRENCLNCHDAHGSHHEKMLIAKRPLLCQRCHDSTRHPSTFYDATSVAQQNNRLFDKACQNCHSQIHGSNHPSGRFFLR